ncbi:MAG: phosphoserine transaminase, partial [Micrococcales bacterium]|nr:phosphoserine transaminase [Micrococcales bacterium]
MATLTIPESIKPHDGRFGSGPSRVPVSALEALTAPGSVMGTSHRQAPVKSLVARIQENLATLYSLPDGYQVVLGNGGSSLFWDIAVSCLIEHRSAHGVWGEFGRKF